MPRHTSQAAAVALSLDAYQVREPIGRGGFGVVRRAIHRLSQVEVAIKHVPASGVTWARRQARLMRGCRLLARLRHPNVVPVLQAGPVPGGFAVVTEFVRGHTLKEHIRTRGPLPWAEALELFSGIVAGVAHAHAHGVVHRDLKPGNVVVDQAGRARVIDFDLAKAEADDATLTQAGRVVGTLAYLSPERLSSGAGTEAGEDVYALGLMLYVALTGRHPFKGRGRRALLRAVLEGAAPPIPTLVDGVPFELVAVVETAMHRDPARRFADAGELQAALSRAARPQPRPRRRVRASRRRIRRVPAKQDSLPLWLLPALAAPLLLVLLLGT